VTTSLYRPIAVSLSSGELTYESAGAYALRSPSTANATLVGYGDSYVSGQGATSGMDFFARYYAMGGYAAYSNRGNGGDKAAHCVNRVLGNTSTPFAAGLGKVWLVDVGLNDVRYGSDGNATYLAEFQLAFATIMRTLTAGTLVNQNAAAFAYPVGSWTLNSADSASSSGTQSFSSTAGATFTYTVPSGVTTVSLVVVGFSTGNTVTWTVNGGSSQAVTYRSTALGGLSYVRCVQTFTGVTTGNVIQGVSTSGTFIVDGALIPSTTPPPILWLLPVTLADWAGTSPTAGSTANRNALAAWVKTQTATYTTLRVIDPLVPPTGVADVWDTSTMIDADTVHPNDRGHEFLARCVYAEASALAFPTTGLHSA
jgi:lysophospholipase L1-like esterase